MAVSFFFVNKGTSNNWSEMGREGDYRALLYGYQVKMGAGWKIGGSPNTTVYGWAEAAHRNPKLSFALPGLNTTR